MVSAPIAEHGAARRKNVANSVTCDAYDSAMDPNGRHVVVTGAANGIGAALAARFHCEGANVVLADLAGPMAAAQTAVDAMNAARPKSAVALAADVSTESGNRDLIAAAEAAFGPIDLFFANAGIGIGSNPIDTSEADWNIAFNVNVHAHRWAAKYLLPGWLERGEGYFCSTASAAGLLAQIGSAPYSVTKHAAVAFAEWLTITYGDRGLRVSCLCPQGVNTALLRAGDAPGAGISSAVVRAAGVVLEPDQVAEITLAAVHEETFLVLPHPEVAQYAQARAAKPDRWLAAMRGLQARMSG